MAEASTSDARLNVFPHMHWDVWLRNPRSTGGRQDSSKTGAWQPCTANSEKYKAMDARKNRGELRKSRNEDMIGGRRREVVIDLH